jgi:uncharacterized protein YbjT (DUF2867 family)
MSTRDLILVTGATGKIGSCIAGHLERLGRKVRLLARDPNKLSDFPAADNVKGDYGDVESLDRAFTGVLSAFIVSGYAEPGKRAKLHRNAFDAAQRAEAAANLLARDKPLLGTFPMTGPSALGLSETAALVGSLKQRTLRKCISHAPAALALCTAESDHSSGLISARADRVHLQLSR